MSIATVDDAMVVLTKEEAASKLAIYRTLTKRQMSRTNTLMYKAVKAAQNGKGIIDLSDTVLRGGFDEMGRPKIAVACADWQECEVRTSWAHPVVSFRFSARSSNSHAPNSNLYVPLPTGHKMTAGGTALVPTIPIEKMPANALSNYWILWEADWKDIPLDPYLLKRIDHSNLFVVLDSWDSTPLERMVMRQARR